MTPHTPALFWSFMFSALPGAPFMKHIVSRAQGQTGDLFSAGVAGCLWAVSTNPGAAGNLRTLPGGSRTALPAQLPSAFGSGAFWE
jgi:hypothetical protein